MTKHITTELILLAGSFIIRILDSPETSGLEVILNIFSLMEVFLNGLTILFLSNFIWQSSYRNNFLS